MKRINTLVKFEQITVGANPRLEMNMNLESLIDSIMGIGLQEPLTVWNPTKEITEVIKGHRRLAAIRAILTREPDVFNKMFGQGIPCVVVKDITPEEAVLLKLDHSEQVSLSDPHELQMSANLLFQIGKTEEEVAVLLAGLIDKIAPMSSKVRVELQEKQAKVDAAKAAGNEAAVTLAERDYKKRFFDYRRGFVQGLHNAARCPDVVMAALYKRATGKAPEGCSEYLPTLTSADVTSLWLAHKEDLTVIENGVQKFGKVVTGPHFNEKWGGLVAKAKEAEGKPKEAKPKAMSAKDMTQEIKDGKLQSKLACLLTVKHSGGEADASLITKLDAAAKLAELVFEHDQTLWAKVAESAKEIEQKLKAAAAAQAK